MSQAHETAGLSAEQGTGAKGRSSTVVGVAILLVFFLFIVSFMLYAMRAIEASYDDFGSLLDRSVRMMLRDEWQGQRLEALKESIFSFIDRLSLIDAKASMRAEKDELDALWRDRPFSLPLGAGDRDRLIGAIERLESSLVGQRRSFRHSFNALFLAISAALVASLIWSAALWHRFRLSVLDASWAQESVRQSLYAEEETKKRIARDLHDDAIQDIAAARMLCDRAMGAKEAEAANRLVAEAAGILAGTGKKLRILARDIRPPDLERSGLVPALEALCARNESIFGKEIILLSAGQLPPLGDDEALQTYRIVQEAIANSMKHAPGGRIELSVEPSFRGGMQGILIKVEDRAAEGSAAGGRGPAPEAETSGIGGLGMTIMRERASYIGAEIEMERKGEGLSLRLFVPSDERKGGVPCQD
jgi:signal transduction histidine kinase